VSAKLPESLILGMIDGQWPVQAFTLDTHALSWAGSRCDEDRDRVRLWRVDLTTVRPMRLVPAVPERLEEVSDGS